MKVTLAYPLLGHTPDETIDVDDTVGRRMLREGLARNADGSESDEDQRITVKSTAAERVNPTVGDIRAIADERGISTTEAKKVFKAELAGESADTGKDAK